MPRKKSPPSYRLHKARNCAVVTIDGKNHYLGPYGSGESHEKYARLISGWRDRVRKHQSSPPPVAVGAPNLLVNELLLAYWVFAETYYRKDGQPTKELACMREALRPVRRLFGHSLARDFGPLALKAVRKEMIESDLSRGVINHRCNRIRRVFKWAVSEQLIQVSTYEALRTVPGLRFGRTQARETEPVKPVPDEHVEALLKFVAPTVRAMIRIQRLTGMRPGEVVLMRECDIDRTGDVWIYEPLDHKNRWRGHRKVVPLGPKAQGILKPLLNRNPEAYLYSRYTWRGFRSRAKRNGKRGWPRHNRELVVDRSRCRCPELGRLV